MHFILPLFFFFKKTFIASSLFFFIFHFPLLSYLNARQFCSFIRIFCPSTMTGEGDLAPISEGGRKQTDGRRKEKEKNLILAKVPLFPPLSSSFLFFCKTSFYSARNDEKDKRENVFSFFSLFLFGIFFAKEGENLRVAFWKRPSPSPSFLFLLVDTLTPNCSCDTFFPSLNRWGHDDPQCEFPNQSGKGKNAALLEGRNEIYRSSHQS